jgi:hypothetical protein
MQSRGTPGLVARRGNHNGTNIRRSCHLISLRLSFGLKTDQQDIDTVPAGPGCFSIWSQRISQALSQLR